MTDFNPNKFDPSVKWEQEARKTDMSKSQYVIMKSRWLKEQATKEGVQYKPGYVPQGYTQTWTSQSAQNPGSIYWKPDAYAKYRPDLPSALWDNSKDVQNYWHNPASVVSWHNRFRVQDEGYEPPEGIDKNFIEDQYSALKDFNDDEDNPLYWKPLPLGHEAAYQTNFAFDPTDNMQPIMRAVNEQLYQPPPVQKRYEEQVSLAQEGWTREDATEQARIQNIYVRAQTSPDAATALSVLKGNIPDDRWKALEFDFYKQGQIPDENGEFVPAPADPRPSYFDLEPWQRGVQSFIGSAGSYKDQPAASSELANAISTVLPAVGLFSAGSQLAGTVLAAGGANPVAATAAGVIEFATVGLSAATMIYLTANKDNLNSPAVQKVLRLANLLSETTERAVGTLQIIEDESNRASGKPDDVVKAYEEAHPGVTGVSPQMAEAWASGEYQAPVGVDIDFKSAWDAAYLTYELNPELASGDWLLDTLSKATETWDKMFGTNLSSGLTTGKDEVWKLNEGIPTPVKVEGGLGAPKVQEAYEIIKALGSERTTAQLEEIWSYYINQSGTSGMLSNMIDQSFADPIQLYPYMTDAGIQTGAAALSKHYADIGDVYKATTFQQLSNAAGYAKGNPAIDMLPIGAQQAAQWALGKFTTVDQYINYRNLAVDPMTLSNYAKSGMADLGSPAIRGSLMLADTMNVFNSLRDTGYMMPGGSEFVIHPGGRTDQTVRLYTAPDGSLTLKNIDGSKTWVYDSSMLDNLGVKFSKSPTGDLTINGMKAVLGDAGFDTNVVPDNVNTNLRWEPVGGGVEVGTRPAVPEPDYVDVTNAEFSDVAPKVAPDAADVYTVTKANKVYTVDLDTDMVTKVTDLDGKELELVRPTKITPQPVKIGDTVMSPADAIGLADFTVLTATLNKHYADPDYKSATDLKMEGLAGKLTALNIKGVDAIVTNFEKLSNLTPGSKAMLEAANFGEAIKRLYVVSDNNFMNTMHAINKLANGTDVGKVTKAADMFMNQSATVSNLTEAFKEAFGDKGIANSYIQQYQDTIISRAYIAKVSKAIKVTPNELVAMAPEAILTKLKNKLAPKKDATSLALMQEMASGTLSAESIGKVLKPFIGDEAIPVTDNDFLAAVVFYSDKSIQDFLIKKYGVTQVPWLGRFMGIRKALLAPQFITTVMSTMLQNLIANAGVQFFMTGGVPLKSKTSMQKMIEAYDTLLPWSPDEKWGLNSILLESVSQIGLLMNPNDSLAKTNKILRKATSLFKAYGAIEKYNTKSLFIKEVENMHRRIPLADMPENTKRSFADAGLTPQQTKLIQDMMNAARSPKEMQESFVAGVEYDAVDLGVIKNATEVLAGGKPEYAPMLSELAERLGADEDFMARARTIDDPAELEPLRDSLGDALEKTVDTMLDASIRTAITEIIARLNSEGMVAGVELFVNVISADMSTQLMNNLRWGDAIASADIAKKAGDFKLSNAIIRRRIQDANRIFRWTHALQDTQLNAMVEELKMTGDKSKPFIDKIVARNNESTNAMAQIAKNNQSYFDPEQTGGVAIKWEEVVANNETLMQKLDKYNAKALEDMLSLWVDALNSKVVADATASGLTVADIKAGGNRIKKKVLAGYAELRELRAQHYADIKDMNVKDRRAASATFWNEVWQPANSKSISGLEDDNLKEFFTVKTDLDKQMSPAKTETVQPAAPKQPLEPGDQAAENVQNRLALHELSESAKNSVDAVHESAVKVYKKNLGQDVTAELATEAQPLLPIFEEAQGRVAKVVTKTPEEIDVAVKALNDKLDGKPLSDKALRSVAVEALELYAAGTTPAINDILIRVDELYSQIDVVSPEMLQPQIPAITMQPLGSTPIMHNIGAGIAELYGLQLPDLLDQIMDTLRERMQDSQRFKYKLKLTPAQAAAVGKYMPTAMENSRLRTLAILEAAKRVSKDLMIDYSRIHGFDKLLEQAFPFQFWFTRSSLLWLKRMVSQPGIAAAAYRYRELMRRNKMYGFPSRLDGKNLIYAPWLPKGYGDILGIDFFTKAYTPEQLFKPVTNLANLDANVAEEAQSYIIELAKQGSVSTDDATKAITEKSGTIWDDAVSYVKLNSMKDETDPFTMASMMMSFDPYISAAFQIARGTPEKISPFPWGRMGNALEAVGGDGIIGIVGSILSFPEDSLRKVAGIPEAGEWGDYYVDYWLANMAVEKKYSTDDIMKAMISRKGAAFDEAKYKASLYIAYRTPGTTLMQAINDGHTDPNTLASAFLMSFLPAGLYPEGEMELRGLKDEYSTAWSDYERGDTEALEKFDDKYPEYKLRMAMFQEPNDRLRGHLINIIWDAYTKLPTANQQIASDTLGDSFKAYFLDSKTRNYNAVDENTLTTWARKLGYQAPATPETEQAATETIEPMQSYPEDTANYSNVHR